MFFNPDRYSTNTRFLEAVSCQGLRAESIRIIRAALKNADAWALSHTNEIRVLLDNPTLFHSQ